ncbi:3-isopropylmalate dehydratase large subunit [Pseudidiomarina gelatinasegens]|uniref:3-isopropylmalate dehydratase large subunit n=1 Tax=Pseudidiomarina gelatinasegens TaxID=2487740 RepID=UPI003A96D7EA
MAAQTLYDKLWERHVVATMPDDSVLLYIDRQLLHEVTSPQAFSGLELAKRKLWRTTANVAVPDHAVPTRYRDQGLIGIYDPIARKQVATMEDNCKRHHVPLIDLQDQRQGIVHVIGPELGLTLPGMTVVCGDSHTSTHGALATLAMGIGSSEVEHVMATQTLRTRKQKNMRVLCTGSMPCGVTPKDLILALIGKIGAAGARGYAVEYAGPVIEQMSMEGRMTICNMTIEAGARNGLVAFDAITQEYVHDKPYAPKSALWEHALADWQTLHSDADVVFDREITIDVSTLAPQVTWGTSPDMVLSVDGTIPVLADDASATAQLALQRALNYMGLEAGQSLLGLPIDKVFIGSCTNARIEDLREVAALVAGHRVAANVAEALIVPGSGLVKKQAESEGLHEIFLAAGFQWRDSGCSMCLGMNDDRLAAGERCASTSNRNFEGRQGKGGRTHLMSPVMAAAAAIHGAIVDVRGDLC